MSNSNYCECSKWESCKYGVTLEWLTGVSNKCCGYILKMNEPRGCDIKDCNKYEPRIRPRTHKDWCGSIG